MFKLLRFYSVTSFIIIFVTATLLMLFYRQLTIRWISHQAATDNLAVAQIALNSIAPDLASSLAAERGAGLQRLPAGLAENIRRMTQGTSVGRIDIHDHDGLLLFSTQGGIKPGDHELDPDFLSALGGNVSSTMTFRDLFNRFGEATPTDNQMRTLIPIRNTAGEQVLGVFETHTDMTQLIEQNNTILLFFWAGAGLILALLYAMLLLVVRHARNIIDTQHRTIQERTASLEILSKRLLKGEELNKKKIATDLHEGLAQTLSAIKINMESRKLAKTSGTKVQTLESIVPMLQHAIHEVRSIATELHPSSLDDLGLLQTLNWFCREFERLHPGIHIQQHTSLLEKTIPPHLKIQIYRIIESAFKNIATHSNTDQIRFELHQDLDDNMIHLVIGDCPTRQPDFAGVASFDHGAAPQFRFAEVKERTSLSGGVFSTTQENAGWVTLCSSWACVTATGST